MRLPPGYARLKDNLGQIIRAHRLAGTGTDVPLPPKVFAHLVGISRVTLSRIEHDRVWPRSETLVAMMDIFMIDWLDVAEPGVTRSPPRRIPDTLQDLQRDYLCRALRAGGGGGLPIGMAPGGPGPRQRHIRVAAIEDRTRAGR